MVKISTVTLAELQFEVEKSSQPEQNRLALHQFLTPIDSVVFGDAAATEYGFIRAGLEKAGTPIGIA